MAESPLNHSPKDGGDASRPAHQEELENEAAQLLSDGEPALPDWRPAPLPPVADEPVDPAPRRSGSISSNYSARTAWLKPSRDPSNVDLEFRYPVSSRVFAVFMSILVPSLITALAFSNTPKAANDAVALFGLYGLAALGCGPLLWETSRFSLLVRKDGLGCNSPWKGKQFIPWADVKSISYNGLLGWFVITPAVGNSFRVSALVPGLITFLEACELFLPWDKLSDAEGGYNTVGRPFTKPNPQTSPDLERDLRAETPVENPSNPEPDESDVQPQNTERMLAVFFGLCGVLASVYLALELPGVTHTAIIPLELTMYALLLMAFLGLCGCLLVVVRKPDLAGFLFLLLYTIPVGLWRDSLFLVFPAGFAVAGGLSLFLVSSESKARSETDSTQDTPPPADRKSRRSQQ